MPTTHIVEVPEETVYLVAKNGHSPRPAHVKSRREKEVYVHYVNTDKRMDEWVPSDIVTLAAPHPPPAPSASASGARIPTPPPAPAPAPRTLSLSGEVIGPANPPTDETMAPLSGPGIAGPSDQSAPFSRNGIEPSKKRKRGRPPREYSARPSPVPPAAHPSRSAAAAAASSPDAAAVPAPIPARESQPIAVDSTPIPTPVPIPISAPTPESNGEAPLILEPAPAGPAEVAMTEEEYDIQHHKQITAQRNFDKVHFGEWQVKTWYFSPYPLTDTEIDEPPPAVPSTSTASPSLPHPHTPKIPGVQKATARSHGRTSDLLAGGLGRNYVGGEKAMLWVCQQCFKYMADGNSYDLHVKYCTVDYPPGTRVYQRGAHSIWEVDGAKQKLYCQNLSLFGKLFIDVKTLFFDCDNFLFYILTDSTSKQDHILGFFSKEKVSYDDYNLACIMTLPPYQRKGYGMLMIEFSYELSRRAGKIGTPERPLSDLGLRSYLAYWVSTLIRFFRHVLSTLPPDTKRITTLGGFPGIMRSPSGDSEDASLSVNGHSNSIGHGQSYYGNGNGVRKTKKKTKGWAGEVEDPNVDADDVPFVYIDDPIFTTQRPFETVQREDGGAVTHVSVRCTLADIARATNLRVEDAAFAMNEVGLLVAHARSRARVAEPEADAVGCGMDVGEGSVSAVEVEGMDGLGGGGAGGTVAITRALVEQVARERNVKRPCMRMAFVRL